jgi:hypothetical protein
MKIDLQPETEFRAEVLELGAAEWLCEDVGGVFVTTDMLNPYVSLFHMVPYPMVRAVHITVKNLPGKI